MTAISAFREQCRMHMLYERLRNFLDALDVAMRHGAAKRTAAHRGARYPATDRHIDSSQHQDFYYQTWDLLALWMHR